MGEVCLQDTGLAGKRNSLYYLFNLNRKRKKNMSDNLNINSNEMEEDILSSSIIHLMKQSEICNTAYRAYLKTYRSSPTLSFEEYANQCWKQYRKTN